MRNLHAVVLAGGPGRRFWPWSTPETPKHALPLLPGGLSLFGDTVRRLRLLVPYDRLWLVTTRAQAGSLRRLAPGLKAARILIEPEARDTAAAIGLAALRISRLDPRAVMVVCPADHRISPASAFARQIRRAAALAARQDLLMTLGVGPDRPAVSYGYLQPGKALGGGFRTLARFHEKPGPARARRYLRAGFLWNSGIFVWRAEVLLAALARHAPDVHAALGRLGPGLKGYGLIPKRSIDYAVMEKAGNSAVLPVSFSWSDWGTWTAWEGSLKPDRSGNRVFGNARLDGACRDTTAVGADPARPLLLSGARGLLAVQAPSGTLVCDRSRAEDIKSLVPAG